jgi:hypothetical protein
MTVGLGDTIHLPVWGATDPNDLADSIAFMNNPLAWDTEVVPQFQRGECVFFDICGFTPHGPGCVTMTNGFNELLWTGGDTVLIYNVVLSVTDNPDYLGQTVCPFSECIAYGPHLWGNQYGTQMVIPIQTYGCLHFTPCQAEPGDANGNEIFNGLDVTFSVTYLKGAGDPPPISCECGQHGDLMAGADSNGDCNFNGIDVTYSVIYLKGTGSPPTICPDC